MLLYMLRLYLALFSYMDLTDSYLSVKSVFCPETYYRTVDKYKVTPSSR